MHKTFDTKGQEGTRLVCLQVRVCISPCLSFFTCTKEKMILSPVEKGFETCSIYRFGMVIPNNLAQS